MKTLKQVVAALPPEVQARYDFSKAIYAGANVRITGIRCPHHGEFSQYAGYLRRSKAGCPACGNQIRGEVKRVDPADFVQTCEQIHAGKGYDFSITEYTTMRQKVSFVCPKHGVVTMSAAHIYYRKQGCGLCEQDRKRVDIVKHRHLSAPAKIRNTARGFFDQCRERHNNYYTYPEQPYLGSRRKILVVCPHHGEFLQEAWSHLNGQGCGSCVTRSSQEDAIAEYLRGLGVTVEQRNRTLLAPKEIDLWLPEHRIGIEYHGLHWHTEPKVGNVHRTKWEMAQACGFQLVQIFEDEWLQKTDIVTARLQALVGKTKRIYARKTDIVVLTAQQANVFLNTHHLQGGGKAPIVYALEHAGEIVAVATFGQARSGAMTQAGGAWEVYRYASVGRVVGGFSKLFKHFVRQHNPQQVVSFCDLRYGTGKVYERAGFTLQHITEPDYWWVPNGKIQRIPRYRTQKHKLRELPAAAGAYDDTKTEFQICADMGWERILGVGSQKWVWTP